MSACRFTKDPKKLTLRVHVPKKYILWPQSIEIGITLRPKYILFGYMDSLRVT